ncbi:MAG: hypothetical protein FD146_2319 [Anaerolineaceae bacterium]|nr:MAG: hypothetical protein FD146_2319 [Anaerolineaceae bacterium]
MKKTYRVIIGIAALLIITCCLLLAFLPLLDSSPGLPVGNCSADALLLDLSAFPSGTTMSSGTDFEDWATVSASHYFFNAPENIEVYHAVEYYNTPLLAWMIYAYNHSIFTQTQYNTPWTKPSEITYSSQIAGQYAFACSNDTNFGYRCMLMARYGRYFVFMRAHLSEGFTVQDIEPLLKRIDASMLPCIDK